MPAVSTTIPEITVQELQELKQNNPNDLFVLDVRNPHEYELCHLNGVLIPINELPTRLDEVPMDKHIVIYCHGGGRSSRAAAYLLECGYERVSNLKGGITAWANEIDPSMPKY